MQCLGGVSYSLVRSASATYSGVSFDGSTCDPTNRILLGLVGSTHKQSRLNIYTC